MTHNSTIPRLLLLASRGISLYSFCSFLRSYHSSHFPLNIFQVFALVAQVLSLVLSGGVIGHFLCPYSDISPALATYFHFPVINTCGSDPPSASILDWIPWSRVMEPRRTSWYWCQIVFIMILLTCTPAHHVPLRISMNKWDLRSVGWREGWEGEGRNHQPEHFKCYLYFLFGKL